MQKGSPYSFLKKIKKISTIINDRGLRLALPHLNLESKTKMDHIKIALMKCKFSFLLATLYCLKN